MADLESASINEFIAHPDYQQIAAFFLGIVFMTSLNYSFIWIRTFLPRFQKWISSSGSSSTDIEKVSSDKLSITSDSSSEFIHPGEHHSLVFTLSLCFAFASIAYFGSLLSFSPNGGATCAFVVAWGGMAAQTARLIGLVILLFEMRDLGIGKLEVYISFASLFAALVLVFVNNAIGTGFLRLFQPLGIAVCYRKHFLPTALATSLIFIFLELFMLLRLGFFITRQTTLASQGPEALRDIRIVKALSLLFLEALTIVPSAVHITVLADFIPLCIGALAVLVAFNYRPTAQGRNLTFDSTSVSPISVAPGDPSIDRTGTSWFARRSFRSSVHRSNTNSSRAPTISDFPQPPTATIDHPFSAQYTNDTALTWPRQSRQRASIISPTETAFSTHEGIIQTVQRAGPPVHARAVVVTYDGISKLSASLERVPDVPPLPVPPKPSTTDEPEAPVLTVPSPSLVSSPTSILMHPWHEKHRPDNVALTSRFSTDTSNEGSKSPSSRASERASYISRGDTIPVPPIPSPPGSARTTLMSPMFSEANGEGGQPRVQLLTFETNVRKGDRRTPVPSFGSSVARR